MPPQIIPKSERSDQYRIIHFRQMEMIGMDGWCTFPEKTPLGCELLKRWLINISQCFDGGDQGWSLCQTSNANTKIYNRFGCQTRNSRASDMFNYQTVAP